MTCFLTAFFSTLVFVKVLVKGLVIMRCKSLVMRCKSLVKCSGRSSVSSSSPVLLRFQNKAWLRICFVTETTTSKLLSLS